MLSVGVAFGWEFYPEPAYFPEIWCGLLISVSLSLYCRGNWVWGAAAGFTALLVRELALPYCLAMVAIACMHRGWKEIVAWLWFLTVYAAYFLIHYYQVREHGAILSVRHALGWVVFGTTSAVLSASRMNFLLLVLPQWSACVFLPLSVLGVVGMSSPRTIRIKVTALLYVALLGVLGKRGNYYWGWLLSPLLAIGICWSPLAVVDLVRCMNGARGVKQTGAT